MTGKAFDSIGAVQLREAFDKAIALLSRTHHVDGEIERKLSHALVRVARSSEDGCVRDAETLAERAVRQLIVSSAPKDF